MDGILTQKQEEVLRIIKDCYLENCYAPSLNELKESWVYLRKEVL